MILIYLVFCFSYLINQDFEKYAVTDFKSDIDKDDYISENYAKDTSSKEVVMLKDYQVDGLQNETINKINQLSQECKDMHDMGMEVKTTDSCKEVMSMVEVY